MSEQQATPAAAPQAEAAQTNTAEQIKQQTTAPEGEVSEQLAQAEEAIESADLSKKEKQDLKRKLKLKVDGQEFEEEIDLADEGYLTKQLQLAKVAQRRMQETAEIRKDLQSFFELLKEDPDAALQEIGLNPEEYAKSKIEKEIERRKKSPEQLRIEELEREIAKDRKIRETEAKTKRDAEVAALQEQFEVRLETDISDALASNTDLPKSPYVVKRITDLMIDMLNRGKKDVSVKDVLPIVKKQFKKDFSEMFDQMPEDILENMVGRGNLDRLRKSRVKKARDSQKSVETAKSIKATGNDVDAKSKESNASKKKVSMNEFFKNLK